MPFMLPFYEKGPFARVTDAQGESALIPLDCVDVSDDSYYSAETEGTAESIFCRLSAPGYMDCTEWSGPFDTLEEAREYIRETYDVDPETGADLEDETETE